ncbi:hypothetical protein Tco_0982991 [Tanacetum coccineum]
MLPILNVQKHLDEEETSGWTIEATDAFQKIKRILDKLPTLGIEICCTPTEKAVLTLVYTTRSLKTIFEITWSKLVTWPHGRNAKTIRYRKTIGKMGSEIENISCLIRPKEGGRGASGEKILRIGRTSDTYVG